ncbi:hypothetical protein FNF28_06667 [Cafeteria roenbergensis]|uniref:Uncharacterized protein n=1 Tax=Cafeteria roenbergensis TaxID=33653 RepID=A0A5A8CSM8_CAFRO|nr:hypothetical protein FNF28_06667 [Cafeteria roenbergensis]
MCPSGKARERGCDGAESWPGRDGSVAITSTPAAGEGLGAAPARVTTPTVTSPASGPESLSSSVAASPSRSASASADSSSQSSRSSRW